MGNTVSTTVKVTPVSGALSVGSSLSTNLLGRMTEAEKVWVSERQASIHYPVKEGDTFVSTKLSKVCLGGITFLYCGEKNLLIRFVGSKEPEKVLLPDGTTTERYSFVSKQKPNPTDKSKTFLVWE